LNPLKQFNIGFVGLSEGKHHFLFEIGNEFLACFQESEIEHGKVNLELTLEKSSTMLVLDFNFKGEVEALCDRCMESFLLPIESDKRLYVKFGEAFSEQTDEIIVISSVESHFDISQYIYEYLHLALPVRRVHADDAAPGQGCDPQQIEKLSKYLRDKTKGSDSGQTPWDVLKSLKF
jgi:uncharacterized protein